MMQKGWRGPTRPVIVTALARELAGFVWAIGVETERGLKLGKAA